jgi:aldehyde dehydrogenase (NAD+)
MQRILKLQREAFLSAPPSGLAERLGRLATLKKMIQENMGAIYKALDADLKKSRMESFLSEIDFVIKDICFAEKNLKNWMKVERVGSPLLLFPARSELRKEAFGQVLVLSPWNYPFQLALAPVVGALAAGNTVVLKPSEISQATSALLETLIAKYFKPEVFTCVCGEASTAQELLKLPFDFIFFTGSTEVGRKVMEAASKNLTPVCLELGGKSPALVDEDVDVNLAAKKIVWGKFFNAGQTCVAPDYVLVPRKLEEKVLAALKKYVLEFFGENPRESRDYGRIVSLRHWQRLCRFVDPAKLYHGGSSTESDRFLGPTLLQNVSWEDAVMKEEIFGPILPVLSYESWELMLEDQRRRPKPLALYFFSRSKTRTEEVLSRLSFGGACVNDTIVHLSNEDLPFGGVGSSGMGAYHGKYSFDLFSHKKAVLQQSARFDLPARYPPYKLLRKLKKL